MNDPGRRPAAVLLDPGVCAELAALAEDGARARRERRARDGLGGAGVSTAARAALDVLAAAGASDARLDAYASKTSASGNRAAPTAAVGPGSAPQMTVAQAAVRLGCGQRRVRQLLEAGELAGRKVAGRLWLADRAAVEALRVQRGG